MIHRLLPNIYHNTGFENLRNNRLEGPNEWITEMMSTEILDQFKRQLLHEQNPIHPIGYARGVVVLTTLIDKAAEKLQVKTKQLRNLLYIGMLTGNFGTLRFFNEAFGKDTLRTLSTMQSDESEERLADVFQTLTGDRNLFQDKMRNKEI